VGRQPNEPRPRNLDPSIYFRKRKDGGGAYHYYFIDPVDNHQRSIKVADVPKGKEKDPEVIAAANTEAGKQKAALAEGMKVIKPADITVPEAWGRFLTRKGNRNAKRHELKHSTKQDYRSQWSNYLEPKFGKLKVSELTEGRINKFVEWLDGHLFDGTAQELRAENARRRKPIADANLAIRTENKRRKARNKTHLLKKQQEEELDPLNTFPQPLLSQKRRDNVIITVRGLCSFCVEERWLKENPGEHLRWRGYVKRAFPIPTYDETVLLLKVIDPFAAPMVEMGLYTGARMGELIAAEWSWIDWEHRRFNVDGSYTHGKLNDTTKSGETRVVPLPARLIKMLTRWQKVCPSKTILFPSKKGNRLSLDTFRQRTWNPAVEAIRRPDLTPHSLRHCYITWIVRQASKSGATSLAIARVSGHKQVSSVEWYVETWNEQLDAIAKGFDRSKEDIDLERLGISDADLLRGSTELLQKLSSSRQKDDEQPTPRPKGKGIVPKRNKIKPLRQD